MQILLGYGVLYLNGTAFGITRGGGKFSLERDFREILADGDMGPVKDRVVMTKETAKLSFNLMENILTKANLLYPAVTTASLTTSIGSVTFSGTATAITGTRAVASGDYNTVTWKGLTLDGKQAFINVTNAFNSGNLEWSLVDKEEVIPECEFTAHYVDGSTASPWTVAYLP